MLRCNPSELADGEFLLVTADEQTAGRGQRGTQWESTKGLNLTFNVGWQPATTASWPAANEQFLVSEITALAVAGAITDTLAAAESAAAGAADGTVGSVASTGAERFEVAIKWPNDIYVGDRKICGMLLEHQLSGKCIDASIAGIGINVNQERFATLEGKAEGRGAPISLRQLVGHEVERETVLESFVRHFMAGVGLLQEGRYEEVERCFTALLYRRTGCHRYRDERGEFDAEFVGIARNGLLTLRTMGGELRKYAFKEVGYVI